MNEKNYPETSKRKAQSWQPLLDEPGIEFVVGFVLTFLSIPGLIFALFGYHFLPPEFRDRGYVVLNNMIGISLLSLGLSIAFAFFALGPAFHSLFLIYGFDLNIIILSSIVWSSPLLLGLNFLRTRSSKVPFLIPLRGIDKYLLSQSGRLIDRALE